MISIIPLVILLAIQSVVQASNCVHVLAIDGLFPNGSFSSPGWPNSYRPNQNCTWYISSLPDTYIKLTVTDFDLQYDSICNDKVLIRPGGEGGVKLCAYSIDVPFAYYSSKNYFNVHFIADKMTNSQSSGFRAEFKALQATCPPSSLDGLSGIISSPNFPDNYPSNMSCEYNITVPLGYQVELNFSIFDIEDSSNCANDYVLVKDLFDQQNTAWVLCGKQSNVHSIPSFLSRGHGILVTFRSDGSIIMLGFEAKFRAIQKAPSHGPTSYVTPTNTVLNQSISFKSTTKLFATKQPEVTKSTAEIVVSKSFTSNTVANTTPTSTFQETVPDLITGVCRSILNYTIIGHSFRKLSTSSDIACVLLCQQSYVCKSVTYLPISQSPGLCTLHKTNTRDTPGSFEEKRHVVYFELIT